eukprot:scaffold44028_cov35-Tisochrysis_lutea.AAC.1
MRLHSRPSSGRGETCYSSRPGWEIRDPRRPSPPPDSEWFAVLDGFDGIRWRVHTCERRRIAQSPSWHDM